MILESPDGLSDLGEVQPTTATAEHRVLPGQHDTNHTVSACRAVKIMLVIECGTIAIPDIPYSRIQLCKQQAGWQAIGRNHYVFDTHVLAEGIDGEIQHSNVRAGAMTHRVHRGRKMGKGESDVSCSICVQRRRSFAKLITGCNPGTENSLSAPASDRSDELRTKPVARNRERAIGVVPDEGRCICEISLVNADLTNMKAVGS